MVDFSKLQKVSNLARELMKHGQANSMDEAMKMASQQIESGNVPEYVDIEAPSPGSESPVPPTSQGSSSSVVSDVPEKVALPEIKPESGSDEVLKKLEDVISQQQSNIAKLSGIINTHTNQLNEVYPLVSKFNGLIAEIAELKAMVKKLQESPMMPAPDKKGQTVFKPSSPPKPPQDSSSQRPSGTGHARSGNYQPDDVSIEKFFYYGGK